MSDLTRCASCGLPGHRYGRNEGMDRYDPMACINQLRGVLEDLLANGQRVEPDYEAAAKKAERLLGKRIAHRFGKAAHRADVVAIVNAAIGDVDPTTDSDPVVFVKFDPMGGLNPPTVEVTGE